MTAILLLNNQLFHNTKQTIMSNQPPSKKEISPATTATWPYSHHSDVDYYEKLEANKLKKDQEGFCPDPTLKTPGKMAVAAATTGCSIPTEIDIKEPNDYDMVLCNDELSVTESKSLDLVQIARDIAEHNRRKAAGEAQRLEEERVAAEELELEEAADLVAANAKKRKAPTKVTKMAPAKRTTTASKKKTTATAPKEDDNDTKATKSRGPNFTAIEDLLACKAYIATSEDPLHGNKIGSASFCSKILEVYNMLVQDYIETRLAEWRKKVRRESASSSTGEGFTKKPTFDFPTRDGKGVWKKYKDISAECKKFYSVEDKLTDQSGENTEDKHNRAMEFWQNSKLHGDGKPFRYFACAEYLRDKPKWRSTSVLKSENRKINKNNDGDETLTLNGMNERPVGKKRATKDKEKRDLVESIAKSAIGNLTNFVEEKCEAAKKIKTDNQALLEERRNFLADASAGLKIFMHDVKIEKMMAMAPSPEKAAMKKKQAAIAMAELEEKELRSKLAIAELKLKLENINKENKDTNFVKI
jgi:hypothetical protein